MRGVGVGRCGVIAAAIPAERKGVRVGVTMSTTVAAIARREAVHVARSLLLLVLLLLQVRQVVGEWAAVGIDHYCRAGARTATIWVSL